MFSFIKSYNMNRYKMLALRRASVKALLLSDFISNDNIDNVLNKVFQPTSKKVVRRHVATEPHNAADTSLAIQSRRYWKLEIYVQDSADFSTSPAAGFRHKPHIPYRSQLTMMKLSLRKKEYAVRASDIDGDRTENNMRTDCINASQQQ